MGNLGMLAENRETLMRPANSPSRRLKLLTRRVGSATLAASVLATRTLLRRPLLSECGGQCRVISPIKQRHLSSARRALTIVSYRGHSSPFRDGGHLFVNARVVGVDQLTRGKGFINLNWLSTTATVARLRRLTALARFVRWPAPVLAHRGTQKYEVRVSPRLAVSDTDPARRCAPRTGGEPMS